MSFSIPIKTDMVNAIVNEVYDELRTKGVKGDKVKASGAAAEKVDFNRDGYISRDELKTGLRNNWVSLSLLDKTSSGNYVSSFAKHIADDVADKMDRSDGRTDRAIKTKYGTSYTVSSVSTALGNGSAVIGNRLEDRATAKDYRPLLELHQNKGSNGNAEYKIVMGQ